MVELNFDFDVVTGPSQAGCPAVPEDTEPEDARHPAETDDAPHAQRHAGKA